MAKKIQSLKSISFVTLFCLLISSCTRVSDQIEPQIDCSVQDRYLSQLPSPFTPLTEEEQKEDWGREMTIAKGFAKELDLYQAITGFKRAIFLLPKKEKQRKLELEYEILLCYYLGKKHYEVIYTFDHTDLHFADTNFAACHDLLVMLFDSYTELKEEAKAERILGYIKQCFPLSAEKLALSVDLREGNLPAIEPFSTNPEYTYLTTLLSDYQANKKSVQKAQIFNSILPGAGYLYLGQKQSAMTALLLNGLFIGASCYFFEKGNIPAGIIFTGFEAGWYFGGIYGAGEEAKFYNERVYEKYATPLMNRKGLFPGLSLQYAF